jgi:hypothetical protein
VVFDQGWKGGEMVTSSAEVTRFLFLCWGGRQYISSSTCHVELTGKGTLSSFSGLYIRLDWYIHSLSHSFSLSLSLPLVSVYSTPGDPLSLATSVLSLLFSICISSTRLLRLLMTTSLESTSGSLMPCSPVAHFCNFSSFSVSKYNGFCFSTSRHALILSLACSFWNCFSLRARTSARAWIA